MARRSSDIRDRDVRSMGSEPFHVLRIGGGDDCSSGQIGDGHHECVDCHLRAPASSSKQLTGAHSHSRVDGMDLDPFSAKSGEDGCIGGASSDDLGKNGSNRCDRQLPAAHLRNERANFVSADGGAMRNDRDRLAVKKQH